MSFPILIFSHPARSLWKARLDSCRLTDLEYVLLDFERDEDVPGELIPSLYFNYVRTRDASRVFRVFTHNRYDIVSLAALTVCASEMLDEDASPEHPIDDYSLGRLFEKAALPERSMRHYSPGVESGLSRVGAKTVAPPVSATAQASPPRGRVRLGVERASI